MEPTKVQFNKNSEERRKQRTKFLFIGLILIIIIIAGCVAFLRKESMQITQVRVVGVEALDEKAIEQSVHAKLMGNYVWIVPKSNVLLFSKSNLKHQLEDQYPGIERAGVSFKDRYTLLITITEKQPEGIWCSDALHCFFIDAGGMMYKQAPVFSEGVYTRFSGNILSVPEEIIRGRFVTLEDFSALKNLLEALKQYPAQTVAVHVDVSGDVFLGIEMLKGSVLGPSTKLLITMSSNQASILQNLDLLLRDKNFTSVLVSRGKDLETIDFRFSGKIYYKFKNSGSVTQLDSATSTHE